jgi:signal peptidase I
MAKEANATFPAHQWQARRALHFALLLCLAAFAVRHFVFWPVVISGNSMAPNYQDGQRNYIFKLAYLAHPPQRGDVVGLRTLGGAGEDFMIKRIIGLPGDRIEFYRGTVIVNGRALQEPYVQHALLWWLDPVQLGPNEYFIMGDNRRYSVLGAVARNDILGKAVF